MKRSLKPPDFLDDEAKSIWRETFAALVNAGVGFNSALDGTALAIFCSQSSMLRRAKRELSRKEIDAAQRRILKSIGEEAEQSMRVCASELGLTPASRLAILRARKRGRAQ